jgi:hypothetical protein
LTQYPIFPWILIDYKSSKIDLDDINVYRDLTKPVGTLNEKSKEYYKTRFENWNHEKIPKFHYGSHYSSSGVTLYYLLRIEPYTSHYLELQDKKFDVPDRLFHSISETWDSVYKESFQDVKELIPEFFYLPEFLLNSMKLQLGKKQNSKIVDNVVLPKWAKDNPNEFIRIHRKALESNYVSQHLNDWIDLIWGYKQTGKEAIDNINVFYYLTYEGIY